jgi:hypothetical protein
LYDFASDASDNPTFYAELSNPQSLNKYQYTYNNPVNMTDDDGHCPVCAVVIEVASIGWDIYETYRTVTDNRSSTAEKVATVVCTAAGLVAPGGGYSTLAKGIVRKAVRREAKEAVAKKADDAVEAAGDRAGTNITPEKAENLSKADEEVIPRSQLGPSGKPKVITVKHATDKRAQDAAQARSKGRRVKQVNPKKGNTHYHATDKRGKPRKGKQNIHHETSR